MNPFQQTTLWSMTAYRFWSAAAYGLTSCAASYAAVVNSLLVKNPKRPATVETVAVAAISPADASKPEATALAKEPAMEAEVATRELPLLPVESVRAPRASDNADAKRKRPRPPQARPAATSRPPQR